MIVLKLGVLVYTTSNEDRPVDVLTMLLKENSAKGSVKSQCPSLSFEIHPNIFFKVLLTTYICPSV